MGIKSKLVLIVLFLGLLYFLVVNINKKTNKQIKPKSEEAQMMEDLNKDPKSVFQKMVGGE